MTLIYEHPGVRSHFPYLVLQEGAESYYKVLLCDRFLFVSHGARVIDRDRGELDIPHVGAKRKPIGDFVYATPAEARVAFERFHASPREALSLVLAGRKP